MKKCFKCLEVKPLEEFYAHGEMSDGHLNKCKACTRKDTKSARAARLDYYRSYDRERGRTEARRDAASEYAKRRRKADPGWSATKRRTERVRHPDKYRARNTMSNAIRDGKLMRQACEECGDPRTHGHHHDYSKPLDVQWLCPKHHGEEHRLYP